MEIKNNAKSTLLRVAGHVSMSVKIILPRAYPSTPAEEKFCEFFNGVYIEIERAYIDKARAINASYRRVADSKKEKGVILFSIISESEIFPDNDTVTVRREEKVISETTEKCEIYTDVFKVKELLLIK